MRARGACTTTCARARPALRSGASACSHAWRVPWHGLRPERCPPAGRGILRGREFERLRWEGGPLRAALADVLRVHEWAYVRALQQARPAASAHREADPPNTQRAARALCADALWTSRAAPPSCLHSEGS